MVNSGTGHDRCPSLFPGPSGAREPPCGGDLEITKTVFGFKGASKIFALIWIARPGRFGARAGRLDGAPLRRELGPGARRGPDCASA